MNNHFVICDTRFNLNGNAMFWQDGGGLTFDFSSVAFFSEEQAKEIATKYPYCHIFKSKEVIREAIPVIPLSSIQRSKENYNKTESQDKHLGLAQEQKVFSHDHQTEDFHQKERIKPFLKWVGGKRQLLPILLENAPLSYNKYIEPFIGGGAFFFELQPQNAIIADINYELVNTYLMIKKHPEEIIKLLKKEKNEIEHFYHVRALDPNSLNPIKRAVRFIYLNKTCFNGVYRENSKGQFNVPFGHRTTMTNLVDEENLRKVSCFLGKNNIRILHQDFKETIRKAERNDFVYLDPPYHPLSVTASFTKYVRNGFCEKDQIELAQLFHTMSDKGVLLMMSNSNTPFIKELYSAFKIIDVQASRAINCKGDKRGKSCNEVLIKNF